MKKVLIITYYWPPCGGIGVLRCLKFAKYLRQFGWEPIIFTAEDAHYPSLDLSNEKDIPEGITILKQKIWEPYHIYKFITGQKKEANVNNVFYASEKKLGLMHKISVWIRSNFFIPDARALWIKPSVTYLSEYLKQNKVDALLSNGPPHSNTRIANLLKKKTGIPWLADFQDPWSQVDYFEMLRLTPWGKKKHLAMEQEVFKYADAITIVSPTWKKDLESIGAKNVSVLPWGYDQDDFEILKNIPDEKFTITHIGILGSDRNPRVLLRAIKIVAAALPDFLSDLQLQLVGLVDTEIKNDVKAAGLQGNVVFTGTVNRTEALQMANNSQVLLLVLNQQDNAEGRVPGKFFEYLGARKPILCLGPKQSDVSAMLTKTKSGHNCAFDDVNQCVNVLTSLYQSYKNNQPFKPSLQAIETYSSKNITGELTKILNEISQER